MPKIDRVLVTGACGFIGSHLVRALLSRGYSIRALDDLSACGDWHWLAGWPDYGNLERIEGDVLDPTTAERCVCDIDIIFHNAAMLGEGPSTLHPIEYHAVNATATLRLLDAARHAGVRRFIFASNCAVYGYLDRWPIDETALPSPRSAYAISKLAAEYFVTLYAKQYGLETVSLRCADTFGNSDGNIAEIRNALGMIMRAVKTSPSSFEDCSNLMFDLCHVNDIVEAALLAAQAPRLSGEVVNIGSGSAVTFREIAELAPGLLGARPDSDDDFSEIPPAHPCYLDITAARKLLGYNPKVQFGELMRRTLSRLRMSDRN